MCASRCRRSWPPSRLRRAGEKLNRIVAVWGPTPAGGNSVPEQMSGNPARPAGNTKQGAQPWRSKSSVSRTRLRCVAPPPPGPIGGRVVPHIIGRGVPELGRFWGEAPLVREPDVTLFGLERLDPPEQEFLARSPLRHVSASEVGSKGASLAASQTLTHLHADARDFVVH